MQFPHEGLNFLTISAHLKNKHLSLYTCMSGIRTLHQWAINAILTSDYIFAGQYNNLHQRLIISYNQSSKAEDFPTVDA